MSPIEINKRVTFFLQEPLILDGAMMQRIQENFTGVLDLMPSYSKKIQFKIAQTGVDTSEEKGIEMRRADDSLKIVFDKTRIDIYSFENSSLQDFVSVSGAIRSILERLDIRVYRRVAMCHQLYYDCTERQFDACYEFVFRDPVTSSVEWNAQRVLREPIADGKNLLINDIVLLGRVLNANVDGKLINDKLLLNIDVNTVPGSDVEAVNDDIELFFNRAIEIIEAHERNINNISAE